MPIQLQCRNGHRLVAQETNAGKTGKCPVCKEPVPIPTVAEQLVKKSSTLSESAVVNILGTPARKASSAVPAAAKTAAKTGTIRPASSVSKAYTKLCPCCEKDIDMGYHICPHCHTYITGLNDF